MSSLLLPPPSSPQPIQNAQAGGFILTANIYTDTFPLPLSDQFISSHRVKGGETREGDAVFPPSNSPHSDSQTIFSATPCHPTHTHTPTNKTMRRTYHIIFFATSIYCPQDSGNFAEEKCLFPLLVCGPCNYISRPYLKKSVPVPL